jgi:acyl carrier protein
VTRAEVRDAILRILGGIAPEADLTRLDPRVPLREQLDIDSMDVLNFVSAIDQELQVSIPEVDYPKTATLDGCVDYVAERLASAGR